MFNPKPNTPKDSLPWFKKQEEDMARLRRDVDNLKKDTDNLKKDLITYLKRANS